MAGRILVLNGVGKSSVVPAMQGAAMDVLQTAPVEALAQTLPVVLQDSDDSFAYVPGPRPIAAKTGPVGQGLIAALPHGVVSLAVAGDVVFDAVLPAARIAGCRHQVVSRPPATVGPTAPLAVSERPRAPRGAPSSGLAREQRAWVHCGVDRDLMVDCAARSPAATTTLICERFDL